MLFESKKLTVRKLGKLEVLLREIENSPIVRETVKTRARNLRLDVMGLQLNGFVTGRFQ